MSIQVQDLNHLGIVAGIIDEMGLVEMIDRQIPPHPQQTVSTGVALKAMILNGLGFVTHISQVKRQKKVFYRIS